jgi:hypothetical protein
MAITIVLQAKTQFGTIEVPNCYVRVSNVDVSKVEGSARVVFLKTANGGILQEVYHTFSYDIEGPNPIKQAYQFLKTLPEFADAVDC